MDALTQLFAIVAAVYAVDCVRWTPRSTLVLRALGSPRFRRAAPPALLGSPRASLVWAQPLPPLGVLLFSEAWPVALGPDGLATREPLELDLHHRPQFAAKSVRWSDVHEIETNGAELLVNGSTFASCGSGRAARALADVLDEVRSHATASRAARIRRALDRALDAAEPRARLDGFLRRTRRLRLLCSSLFVWIGVVAPLAVFRFGIDATWIVVLAVGLVLHVSVVLAFARAFKNLLPDCVTERMQSILAVALSPMGAVRSLDELSRHLIVDVHPLAAARLLEAVDRRQVERAVALDVLHPRVDADVDPLARETDAWFREQLADAYRRAGFDPRASLTSPEPEDAQVTAYCARCLRQFDRAPDLCFDCSTPTLRFERPTNSTAAPMSPEEA